MSRRDTTPRRRKKSAASRLSRFWILAVAIAVAAAIGGYFAATWSGFNPSKIAVVGNDALVPTGQVLAAAGLDRRRNVWLQDTHAAAARVEAIAYVATARVHRLFPASVTIAVTERAPFAMVGAYGSTQGRALVDADLRVLSDVADDAPAAMPTIETNRPVALAIGSFLKDPEVVAMRDDLGALRAAHVDVVDLRYDKYESLIVRLRDGTIVLLGDDGEDLQKKIALIGPIRAQLAKGRPIAAIDLRAPNTPVVRYK
ncbi:MAG TPA: FtsQ-type POTRA domain-containing protein [Candidatus Baltobacteraceae bacterium]|jgi:cell division septal protein FtsQ